MPYVLILVHFLTIPDFSTNLNATVTGDRQKQQRHTQTVNPLGKRHMQTVNPLGS